MGEVYLAEDTRLQREVAIEVLPSTRSKSIWRRKRGGESQLATNLHWALPLEVTHGSSLPPRARAVRRCSFGCETTLLRGASSGRWATPGLLEAAPELRHTSPQIAGIAEDPWQNDGPLDANEELVRQIGRYTGRHLRPRQAPPRLAPSQTAVDGLHLAGEALPRSRRPVRRPKSPDGRSSFRGRCRGPARLG